MFKGKDCSESRSLDFSSHEFENKTRDNGVISQMGWMPTYYLTFSPKAATQRRTKIITSYSEHKQ